MIRAINNLVWRVHSPSLFELVSEHPERVYVHYEDKRWKITYIATTGHQVSCKYNSRTDAMKTIATRSGVI